MTPSDRATTEHDDRVAPLLEAETAERAPLEVDPDPGTVATTDEDGQPVPGRG